MEDKKINKKCLFVAFIPFVLGLVCSFFFMFNKNNVSASTSTGFVDQNEYTISLGLSTRAVGYYVDDIPYTAFESSAYPLYISFTDNDWYLSYPTGGGNVVYYSTVKLSFYENSELRKFSYNSLLNIAVETFVNNTVSYDIISMTAFEINVPIQYDNLGVFERSSRSRTLFYRDSDELFKSNTIYFDSLESQRAMSVYMTFDYLPQEFKIPSSHIYCNDVVRFDRREYVKTIIKEVYVDPISDPIRSIVNGVSNFFNIEVFPNFALGNIFLIVLGVAFFGFVLHLLVK